MILLLASNAALSAEEVIIINGKKLSIGMSEAEIYKIFSPYYRLSCPSVKNTSCLLFEKNTTSRYPKANIVFTNGKISSVIKYWSPDYEGSSPVPFGKTLYHLISKLSKDGPVTVTLSTYEIKEPGIKMEMIHIDKGNKTITIEINDSLNPKGQKIPTYINVYEKIR